MRQHRIVPAWLAELSSGGFSGKPHAQCWERQSLTNGNGASHSGSDTWVGTGRAGFKAGRQG